MKRRLILSRDRQILLIIVLVSIVGLFLRLLYPGDMEYKEDEAYYFVQSQIIGKNGYWPWVGIPSGAYLRNPGGTIWIFAALARLTGATTPIALSLALRIFQWLSLWGIFPVFRRVGAHLKLKSKETRDWSMGVFAWAMLNPFLIYYARKLWTQAFLPAFVLAFVYVYLGRSRPRTAMLWGLIGALLGQIHMSGFFMAFGVFLATLLSRPDRQTLSKRSWLAWFGGSTLGALPLIPWLWDAWQNPPTEAMTRGWTEAIQLKFWVFSVTQPVGLHLGGVMGVNRGPTQWDQLGDFIRYPLLGDQPTYLCGLSHAFLIAILMAFLYRVARSLRKTAKSDWKNLVAGVWGWGGAALTATCVQIRRYYVAVSFPLDTALYLRHLPKTLWVLGALAQALISASFIQSIHRNAGAPLGDYGPAYHTMVEN